MIRVFPHSLLWNSENKNDLLHITRIYTAVEFRMTRVRLDSGKVKGRKMMTHSQSAFSDLRALKQKVAHAMGRCCSAQQKCTSTISQHTLMGCGVGRSCSKVYNAICYLQNAAKQQFPLRWLALLLKTSRCQCVLRKEKSPLHPHVPGASPRVGDVSVWGKVCGKWDTKD